MELSTRSFASGHPRMTQCRRCYKQGHRPRVHRRVVALHKHACGYTTFARHSDKLLKLEKEIRALCLHRIEGAGIALEPPEIEGCYTRLRSSIEKTKLALIKCRTESNFTGECRWFKREWLIHSSMSPQSLLAASTH